MVRSLSIRTERLYYHSDHWTRLLLGPLPRNKPAQLNRAIRNISSPLPSHVSRLAICHRLLLLHSHLVCLLDYSDGDSPHTLFLSSGVTVMSWSSSQQRRVHRSPAVAPYTNGNGGHSSAQQRGTQENGHSSHRLHRATRSSHSLVARFLSQPYSALLVTSAVLVTALLLLLINDSAGVAEAIDDDQSYAQPLFRRRVAPSYRLPSESATSCSIQPFASLPSSLTGVAALTSCMAHSSKVAVVSTASPHPTAGMIGLTQLTTQWCVLAMAARPNISSTTFAAGVSVGISSYSTAMRERGEQTVPRADSIDTGQVLSRIAYISHDEQQLLPYRLVSLAAPAHFTAKNVGYLLALHAGAKTIFDMDDTTLYLPSTSRTGNIDLPFDTDSAHYISAQSFTHSARGQTYAETSQSAWLQFGAAALTRPAEFSLRDVTVNVFNPHPVYGRVDSWPRGFPIDWVHATLPTDPLSYDGLCLNHSTSVRQFCRPVIQHILSNQRPDVDAIYTTTVNAATSISDFLAPNGQRIRPSAALHAPAVALPTGVYMPFNSRATVWSEDVFFAMLLPSTVPARVADVWRSYIAETLLSFNQNHNDLSFCVAVTAPHVA